MAIKSQLFLGTVYRPIKVVIVTGEMIIRPLFLNPTILTFVLNFVCKLLTLVNFTHSKNFVWLFVKGRINPKSLEALQPVFCTAK